MKVLVDLGHPKHVNMLNNTIRILEERGHTVKITSTDKENTLQKLEGYGFTYESRKHYKGFIGKAIGLVRSDFWLYKVAKKYKPDVLMAYITSPAAHVSALLGKPFVAYTDVEGDFVMALMKPFADVILIPSCFTKSFGSKEVRLNSYFELAYLHPNHFIPDPSFLKELGLTLDDSYILIKISSLDASHDVGATGLNFESTEDLLGFIKKLEPYGYVFIETEIKLGKELENYILKIPINEFHNCVYYAKLYLGDGASIAAEAAVLGTPSIYITNARRWGFIVDLCEKYELLFIYSNRNHALQKALELLKDNNLKEKWKIKREQMLNNKTDPINFMVKLIEGY